MNDNFSRAGKVILIMIIVVGTLSLLHKHSNSEREGSASGQTPEITANIGQKSAQATFEDLLDAIEWVESKGDPNAIGDNGNAVGNFQIHKIYVDDVNRIKRIGHKDKYLSPMNWKYYHRTSPYCSRSMVKTYLEHYTTKKRIGREPTFEDMARIHNGGPDGWKKDCTKSYWLKVKMAIERE